MKAELPSVKELKLLDNNQIEISFNDLKTKKVTIPSSDFKFNVTPIKENKLIGSRLPGFVIKAGENYYHVSSNARINRVLLEKVIGS